MDPNASRAVVRKFAPLATVFHCFCWAFLTAAMTRCALIFFSISPQSASNSLFSRSRRNAPNAITAKCTFTQCSCALLTKARPYFTSASSASTSITSTHEARLPQPMGFRSTMYKVEPFSYFAISGDRFSCRRVGGQKCINLRCVCECDLSDIGASAFNCIAN
jgi:hypothetical protein